MCKNNFVKFRCSREEKERILDNARMNGYHIMSDYLRALALNGNLLVQIHDKLSRLEEFLKNESKD